MNKVLIIEDDNMIGDMLSMYLSEEGYMVKRAETGKEGLELLSSYYPNILLLDLLLPDGDGFKLCAEIRTKSNLPILIVSMKTDVMDRVHALEVGADDFLCKPYSMKELTARIAALLRRSQIQTQLSEESAALSAPLMASENLISIDFERRSIQVARQPVETTFSEFEIMRLFLTNPGRVYSREELINALRGIDSFVTDRSIDVHIANLRKKVESDPKEPKHIKTVWGVGYKFVV